MTPKCGWVDVSDNPDFYNGYYCSICGKFLARYRNKPPSWCERRKRSRLGEAATIFALVFLGFMTVVAWLAAAIWGE